MFKSIKNAIAAALRALAERIAPTPMRDGAMDEYPRVYILAVTHVGGWDAGGAVWLFDRSSEFERARLYADHDPQLRVTYATDNGGAPDFICDAGEFIRWARHVTSES